MITAKNKTHPIPNLLCIKSGIILMIKKIEIKTSLFIIHSSSSSYLIVHSSSLSYIHRLRLHRLLHRSFMVSIYSSDIHHLHLHRTSIVFVFIVHSSSSSSLYIHRLRLHRLRLHRLHRHCCNIPKIGANKNFRNKTKYGTKIDAKARALPKYNMGK